MTQVQLPNGQYVNIDSSGNILTDSGGVFTGGGAPVPAVEQDNVPMRNEQQNNPYGYGGTPENPITDASLARINASAPQPPTRNPGESASDYATRLLNSPFYLAGGNGAGSGNAFVIDPATGKYVSRPASSLKRTVNSSLGQNSLLGASTVGTGDKTSGSDAIFGYEDEVQKRAQDYLESSFKAPETEEQILARKTEQAKNRIQSNKDFYASLLTDQAKVNEQRTRETNAQAVLRGLSGSSEAGTMFERTGEENNRANRKILAEQAVALEEIYSDIQNSAQEEFIQQKEDAYKSATDIIARREAVKTKAVADITTLAKSGFDFANIKANDPQTYEHLAKSVGGEAQLKALSVLNRPQESIIDKKIEGGKYVIAYQNPITGKTRIESVDLGIPAEYTKSFDLGDRLMIVPENFDPTKDKPIYVPKGITPKAPGEGTEGERKTSAFSIINKLIQPGVKDKRTGVPYVSPDGYLTFEGFKTLVQNAVEDNISRDEFLAQYASMILPGRGKEYGLTPAEIKKYGI